MILGHANQKKSVQPAHAGILYQYLPSSKKQKRNKTFWRVLDHKIEHTILFLSCQRTVFTHPAYRWTYNQPQIHGTNYKAL